MANSDKDSRESSPRALWRRAGRRKSSSATLEEKLSRKKNKQQNKSHSPDSSSSREPSPKFGEGTIDFTLKKALVQQNKKLRSLNSLYNSL